MNRKLALSAGALALAVCLSGCRMFGGDMDMSAPPRSPEMDRLEQLVGNWEGTGEMRFRGSDEIMTATSKSTIAWAGDKQFLIEQSEFQMGEGDKMHGIGIWSWDHENDRYRMTWIDSMGGIGIGHSTYNPATDSWTMRARSEGPMGSMRGKGTMTLKDNTMTWTWSERPWYMFKPLMEMSGTSTKK